MNREDRAPTRAAGGAAPKTPGVAEEARGTDAAGADGVRRTVRALDTPHGSARAHAWTPPQPVGALVLSHGAGAGSGDWTPDLAALTRLATDPRPWQVVLVEQPWKVAGRKVAAPPRQLENRLSSSSTLAKAGRSGRPRLRCSHSRRTHSSRKSVKGWSLRR